MKRGGGEIAEGGIMEIKGNWKMILRLQYNCTNDNEKNNMSNEVIQEKEQGGENAKE